MTLEEYYRQFRDVTGCQDPSVFGDLLHDCYQAGLSVHEAAKEFVSDFKTCGWKFTDQVIIDEAMASFGSVAKYKKFIQRFS